MGQYLDDKWGPTGDFVNDLNAINEICIKHLTYSTGLKMGFHENLKEATGMHLTEFATARERCIAFIVTKMEY